MYKEILAQCLLVLQKKKLHYVIKPLQYSYMLVFLRVNVYAFVELIYSTQIVYHCILVLAIVVFDEAVYLC